jgi:antitoxin component YwqK of YwqJK toxin-antitoxin module
MLKNNYFLTNLLGKFLYSSLPVSEKTLCAYKVSYNEEYYGEFDFQLNNLHGRGVIISSRRDMTFGCWKNGQPLGRMRYICNDSEGVYFEEYIANNGIKQGKTVIYHKDGRIEEGEYALNDDLESYKEGLWKDYNENR